MIDKNDFTKSNNMELLKQTETWVQGEITQGRVMIVIGILLLIAGFFIWKGNDDLLKGVLIPLGLVVLLMLGVGIGLPLARKKQLAKVEIAVNENVKMAIEQEDKRMDYDKNAYRKYFISWSVLILISLILFFVFKSDYYKGLSLGLVFLGLSLFTIDATLQHRSAAYHENILKLKNQ